MIGVAFSSDYDQRFVQELGDEKFRFDARWNERGKTWTFDMVIDATGEVLLAGAPMQVGQDVLAPYALGRGSLIFVDLSRKNTDAGPEDLGTRVVATWFSPDEMAAIKALLGPGAGLIATGVVPRLIAGNPGAGGTAGGTGGSVVINQTVNNVSNTFNSEGGGGLAAVPDLDDVTGDEVVIARFIKNTATNPNPTLGLEMAVLARGDGTVRVYTGGIYETVGTVGTPTGSLRDSAAVSGAGENPYDLSASFANPSGFLAIKVTMQSSAPATSVGVVAIDGGIG
jgi:hypothetical protein